jgi:alpha-methylacyl-CoA racemase
MTASEKLTLRPLKGLRILSLALNLPGPAALMRCQQLGARCVKLESPAGDPMQHYSPAAYADLHQGIRITTADLKTASGQKALHRELAKADVLLTSFRPSALVKLGLTWKALHRQYPELSQVAIVGGVGAQAEEPGHDLTYLAENGLVTGLNLPATLFADMSGSLMASEAVLQAALHRVTSRKTGKPSPSSGVYLEVALSNAASYLALPRAWGLTTPGAAVGGGHAGYQIYPCKNGRVAVAAIEPHFATRLCAAAGLAGTPEAPVNMQLPATRLAIAAWLLGQTRAQLDKLARDKDIPMHTLERKP